MEIGNTLRMRTEAASRYRGKRVTNSIIEIHRSEPIEKGARAGQHKINQEHSSGRRTYFRAQLVESQTRHLGRIDVAVLHLVDGDEGKREDDDAKTSYPLCKGAPEEQTFRQGVYLVDTSGSSRSETAHRLEECACQIHVCQVKEGHHSDNGEDNPGEGNNEEIVGSTHPSVLFSAAQEDTERACSYRT